jgi:hypothetical protein
LDAADLCEDCIFEAAPQLVLASVAPLPKSNTLLQRIQDLTRQVAALSSKGGPPSLQLQGSPPQLQETPPGPQIPLPRWCYVHPLLVPSSLWRPGAKVHRSALTASRKTNTADINGGTSALQPQAASSSRTGLVNANDGTFPCLLQHLSNHLRVGVIWEPLTLN